MEEALSDKITQIDFVHSLLEFTDPATFTICILLFIIEAPTYYHRVLYNDSCIFHVHLQAIQEILPLPYIYRVIH